MKCLTVAFLLALGAVATATSAWTPGRQYVYEYRTRTMTGIPYLKNQVSGLGLRSKVIVQVQSNNDLLVKMSEIGVAQVANQIFPDSWSTWRKELPLSYTPLESSQGLNIPFKILLSQGQVQEIEVSSSEPIWAVNIKRALASQLVLNMEQQYQSQQFLGQNEISQQRSENFFTVEKESSVTGKCKTYYTVVPLPEYVAKLEERDIPQEVKSKNQQRPAWIITKTKDYNRCVQKPSFIHSSVVDVNEEGSSPADSMHKRFTSRTSVARYLIRGEPYDKFVIERVWTEGEFIVRPFATETESIFISSNQTLVLKQEESIQSPLPLPSSKVTKSLVYQMQPHQQWNEQQGSYQQQQQWNEQQQQQQWNEQQQQQWDEQQQQWNEQQQQWDQQSSNNGQQEYDQEYQELQQDQQYEGQNSEQQQRARHQRQQRYQRQHHQRQSSWERDLSRGSLAYPQLRKAPKMMPFSGKQVPVRKVQDQIKQILSKCEQELETLEEVSQKDLPHKMIELSQAFTTLDQEHIAEVYRELFSTSQGLSKAKKTMQSLFLDAVAMSGTNPCIVFIKDLILKREIKGERAAQLLMVLPATIKTPTPELIQELVQLVKEVKSFDNKQVWYTALLSISTTINRACVNQKTRRHNWAMSPTSSRPYCTEESVELLLPYLKQQIAETKDHYNYFPLVQALGNLGSHQALPLLKAVVQGEFTQCKQVRTKAIFALSRLAQTSSHSLRVKIQAILKPIFSSPVEEQEVRMAAFIVLISTRPDETFFTEAATGTWFESNQQVGQLVYSTLSYLANSSYPTHYNLTQKAAMALPLAKKYQLGAQYSKTYLVNHVIPKRHLGSLFEYIQFSGKHSLVPEQMYVALKNHLGGFDMPIIETSFQIQGIQSLINRIIGPENRQQVHDSGLNIHTRKDYPLSGSYWLRLMGNMERVFTLETLKEWAQEGIVEYTGQKSYSVNYQKTLPLEDIIFVFPVESGLPVYVSKKIPLLISIRGQIEIEMDSKQFSYRRMQYPSEAKLKLNLKPFVSMTQMIEAGVSSPLTKEVFLTGHKTNYAMTFPATWEIQYKNNQVDVLLKDWEKSLKQLDLISVKSSPYTAQVEFYNFVNKNIKPIKADQQMAFKKYNFGQKYTGITFQFEGKKPGQWNFGSFYQLLKPHTFLTASQFLIVPHNLREYDYRLSADTTSSQTQSIHAKFFYDREQRKFSMVDYEYEQNLESKYYKQQQGASSKFASMKQAFQKFMKEQQRYEQEEYERNVHSSQARRRFSNQQQDSELQVQTESTGRTYSIHMELDFQGSQKKYRSSSVLAVSPCSTMYKYTFIYEREASSDLSAYKVYANAQIKYPNLPVSRQQILNMEKQVLGHASIHYGQSGSRSLEAQLVLSQTPEWREKVGQNKVSKECQKYEQEGSPYSPNCLHARREASSLNRALLKIHSQDMSQSLYNYTLHADDLFKAYFYPYLTNRRLDVHNAQNQVTIIMDIKPVVQYRPWPLISFKIYKPRENTFIDDVKISSFWETILPFNAEMSTPVKALNKIFGWQYTPFCEISREEITTFDNVTYKYPLDNCYHLIAKDCSKKIPVEVLAKQNSEGKYIKFTIGKMIVEVNPELQVKVDGSQVNVELFQEKIFKNAEGRVVLVVLRTQKNKVKVTAPVHGLRIKSDGKHFRVEMSNMYRGRACGLCGDMNGEKVAEMKDPQGCVRIDAQAFGQSYALGSCARSSRSSSECMQEASSYAKFSGRQSLEMRQHRPSTSSVKYVTKVVQRGGETCFSVKPVLECRLGSQPSAHVTKEFQKHFATTSQLRFPLSSPRSCC